MHLGSQLPLVSHDGPMKCNIAGHMTVNSGGRLICIHILVQMCSQHFFNSFLTDNCTFFTQISRIHAITLKLLLQGSKNIYFPFQK